MSSTIEYDRPADLSARYGVSYRQVLNAIQSGAIPARRGANNSWLVPRTPEARSAIAAALGVEPPADPEPTTHDRAAA